MFLIRRARQPTLIIVGLCLLPWLSTPGLAQDSQSREGLRQLEKWLDDHRYLKFRELSEKDPYQNGYRSHSGGENHTFLALSDDGRYVEYSTRHRTEGSYQLGQSRPTLRLQQSGQRSQASPHQFQIQSFSQGRLVLGWQGRHGYVKRVYLLVEAVR